jgi:hypothetical protein
MLLLRVSFPSVQEVETAMGNAVRGGITDVIFVLIAVAGLWGPLFEDCVEYGCEACEVAFCINVNAISELFFEVHS